ncbi:MAG: nucleotidyltransferase domain-containing protein [Ignavibacterium sp.]|jgi:predicted nucleotidyltransferase|nr:nucleotidyltransferase domain-containing protein [Ignavibacterium sp.]
MTKKDNILLKRITDELKEYGFNIHGLYLFGSRAKNSFRADSDYDVAIILNQKVDWRLKDKVREVIYDIMLEQDIVIDSHIYSKEEIALSITPLRESIKSTGIFYES